MLKTITEDKLKRLKEEEARLKEERLKQKGCKVNIKRTLLSI